MNYKISEALLVRMYLKMLLIRRFEERIVELYSEQEIRTPVHLCVGQEASAVGVCAVLRDTDYLFSHHRCHGHCIAKGMDIAFMMAELYGKKRGCSGGKGGSMHLCDPSVGVMGTSSIVAGAIPLAVGTALASRIKNDSRVSVVFFGDGAVENGAFHESLNFAGLKKLPVIFVCENNRYATYSELKARQAEEAIYKKSESYGILGFRVNGNDCPAVYASAANAVKRARTGRGPTLLEFMTYRWKEHAGIEDDTFLGYRSREEVDYWVKRCPVAALQKMLLAGKIVSLKRLAIFKTQIDRKIDLAVQFAKNSDFPNKDDLMRNVYR